MDDGDTSTVVVDARPLTIDLNDVDAPEEGDASQQATNGSVTSALVECNATPRYFAQIVQ